MTYVNSVKWVASAFKFKIKKKTIVFYVYLAWFQPGYRILKLIKDPLLCPRALERYEGLIDTRE